MTEALRVGCAGFPVGRDRYWRSLSFVEARTGEAMPRPATLSAWRADAPDGAEFAVQAYRLITHAPSDRGFPPAGRRLTPARRPLCGWFRDSLEVHEAWLSTKAAAEALGARLVVFETPASFAPGPDRLRDMYRFFRNEARGRLALVWQAHGAEWTPRLADKVCADLGLLRGVDPLREAPPSRGSLRYLRPRGPRVGGLGVDDLSTIRAAAADAPSYVAFSHRDAFRDAERLLSPRRIS
ncbi:MAG: DUF72 domain-containing protein [Elusimicrobia bacterium]|nr:DUF72 domain-containing protein [Elusimicrobiota bacterium]